MKITEEQYKKIKSRWYGSEKNGKQSIGKTRGVWKAKIHMIATSDKYAINFSLSYGEAGDETEKRKLMEPLLPMDRAYKRNETQNLAYELGYMKNPWAYDKVLYKSRNQVERLFR